MTDNQLLKSCLEGDTDKFRQIVEKYKGKATGLAINILGNREDAEDACQEINLISIGASRTGFLQSSTTGASTE